MSSEKQIEANRLNAQKSTGPRTPDGKTASSRNALTHGLCARSAVIPGEDAQAFASLLQELRHEHQPQSRSEEILVEQMATTYWQRGRLAEVEQSTWRAALLDAPQNAWFKHCRSELPQKNLDQEFPLEEHCRSHIFANSDKVLDRLAKHEMRLQRSFHRALRDLQRLKATRPQPGSQPPQAEPPAPEPLPPPLPEAIPVPPEVVPQPPAILPRLAHSHSNSPKRTHFDRLNRRDSLQPVGARRPFGGFQSSPTDAVHRRAALHSWIGSPAALLFASMVL